MREKRDEIIILRTTKTEKNRIYEKMLGMGIRSLFLTIIEAEKAVPWQSAKSRKDYA